MKRLYFLIYIGVLLFAVQLAYGGDRTIQHYDREGNRIGRTVWEKDRASHFDLSGNRLGYSVENDRSIDHFSSTWERIGKDFVEDDSEDEKNID